MVGELLQLEGPSLVLGASFMKKNSLQANLQSPSLTPTEVLAQLANLPEDGNSKEVTGWKNDSWETLLKAWLFATF